jgi:hypothetical protein
MVTLCFSGCGSKDSPLYVAHAPAVRVLCHAAIILVLRLPTIYALQVAQSL